MLSMCSKSWGLRVIPSSLDGFSSRPKVDCRNNLVTLDESDGGGEILVVYRSSCINSLCLDVIIESEDLNVGYRWLSQLLSIHLIRNLPSPRTFVQAPTPGDTLICPLLPVIIPPSPSSTTPSSRMFRFVIPPLFVDLYTVLYPCVPFIIVSRMDISWAFHDNPRSGLMVSELL